SAVPNSTAAGLLALKGVDKPVLLMKPFLLKNTAWNWGNAVNSTDLAVRVLAPEHAVFRGLPLTTDNQLVLFGKNDRYAVTYIDQWYDASATLLAEPVSADGGWAVAEMPAGSVMNGTTLTHTMLMIGMSEYSSAHATDAANRLVENACRYLLDMPVQSRLEEVGRDAQIERRGDNLYLTVNGRKADAVRLCDASGRLVQTAVDGVIHLAGLEHGVYLLCGAGRVFKVFR
ncbi:MAG: hypothetical protein IJ680_09470, partial [Paludibacteraceae bacterium]|nr:hypothetical protein [Paludibacteraceae bacterium]